jgi:hypothetical protein
MPSMRQWRKRRKRLHLGIGVICLLSTSPALGQDEFLEARTELQQAQSMDQEFLDQSRDLSPNIRAVVESAREHLRKVLAMKQDGDAYALLAVCDTILHDPMAASDSLIEMSSFPAQNTDSTLMNHVHSALRDAYASLTLHVQSSVTEITVDGHTLPRAQRSYRRFVFGTNKQAIVVYLPTGDHTISVRAAGGVSQVGCEVTLPNRVGYELDVPLPSEFNCKSPTVQGLAYANSPPTGSGRDSDVLGWMALDVAYAHLSRPGHGDVNAAGGGVGLLVTGSVVGPLMMGADFGASGMGGGERAGYNFNLGYATGLSGSWIGLTVAGGGGGDSVNLGLNPAWYGYVRGDLWLWIAPWLSVVGGARQAWRTQDSIEQDAHLALWMVCLTEEGPTCFRLSAQGSLMQFPGVSTTGFAATLGGGLFGIR